MRILLLIALFLVVNTLTFGQPRRGTTNAGPCSCDDRAQLQNRLAEVDAAIAAYEIAELEGRGKLLSSGGKDLTGNLIDLETQVEAAMRQVSEYGGARKIQGEAGAFDCRNELSGQTPCFAEIAKRHQAIRQQQCEKRAARRAAGAAINLEEFAEDQIKAYEAERKYILAVLDALTLCKPRGWFGTVTYSVTTKYDTEHKSTWGLKRENETRSSSNTTTVASGVIRLGDSTADQSENVSYTRESSSLDLLQIQCHVGKKGIITQSDTSKAKEQGGDQATKSLPASKVTETRDRDGILGSIGFSSLSYTIQTTGTSDFHTTGCKEETKPSSFKKKVDVAGVSFKLGRQLSSDGLTFSGHESYKRPGLVAGDIKVNESVITATWSLHRLPR